MPIRWDVREHAALVRYVLRWLLLTAPVGVASGTVVALFLWSLAKATAFRWGHPWLLGLLPLAGVGIVAAYHHLGKNSDGGNNLILEQIHEPGGGVPLRMAPLVLLGTVATHLFGGSAGREGTAVQIGGSIAQGFAQIFRLQPQDVSILLTAGVAAGFGAVFGTPLTGAVFALEVLALGRMRYDALIPCLMASIIGDATCSLWGIHHTQYRISSELPAIRDAGFPEDCVLFLKIACAAIPFGLAGFLFAETTHSFQAMFKKLIGPYWLRPVAGAGLVLGISWLLGTRSYLGLGVASHAGASVSILSAFKPGGVTTWSWLWKLLLTALTLSSGFKGGEVTPLFFVGATLGAALAHVLNLPVDLMAGLGFVAVFAGATNTPLACTIMGVELFGAQYLLYFAVACFLSYLFSGHSGIYLSQRIGIPKGSIAGRCERQSLRLVRQERRVLFRVYGKVKPPSKGEPQ